MGACCLLPAACYLLPIQPPEVDALALERREPPGHGLYARLCGAPPASAEVAEQIELDVVRTNVGEGEAGEVEARRAALRRVLLAWAR